MRYDETWKYVAAEIKSWEYDVEYVDSSNTKDYDRYDLRNISEITKTLSSILFRGLVKEGDIFIFPNARDPLVILLREYFRNKKISVIFIGFWIDKVFYIPNYESKFRKGVIANPTTWSYYFEKTIAECLDYNLLTNVDERVSVLSSKRLLKYMTYCPLPFSGTKNAARLLAPDIEKDDVIIMNVPQGMKHDTKIFNIIQLKHPHIKFVNFYEHVLSFSEYYRLLSRAKVQISTNMFEVNPYTVYEGMILGCLPLMPNIQTYINIFEKDMWLYDTDILKLPFYTFLKGQKTLYDKLYYLWDNYDTIISEIDTETGRIHDKYFDSSHFKKILEKI